VQSTAITNQMELQQRNHPPSAAYKKATGFLQKTEVMVCHIPPLKSEIPFPFSVPSYSQSLVTTQ